jgi:hypothetical protein
LVEIVVMNEASETIVDRLAMHEKPGVADKLMAHSGGDNQPKSVVLRRRASGDG